MNNLLLMLYNKHLQYASEGLKRFDCSGSVELSCNQIRNVEVLNGAYNFDALEFING